MDPLYLPGLLFGWGFSLAVMNTASTAWADKKWKERYMRCIPMPGERWQSKQGVVYVVTGIGDSVKARALLRAAGTQGPEIYLSRHDWYFTMTPWKGPKDLQDTVEGAG